MKWRTFPLILCALICSNLADAAPPAHRARSAEPARYDWRNEAEQRGLRADEIAHLAQHGVLLTGRDLTLKSGAKIDGFFVTSDLILHAYNAMVADLVQGLDTQRMPALRRELLRVWNELPGWTGNKRMPESETLRAAIRHAQRVLGPALLCLDAQPAFADAELERECRDEYTRIIAAAENALPDWLPGSVNLAGIDYTRMKPVGFYATSARLRAFFHAVRWLQVVPFRSTRDHELLAAAILADLSANDTWVAGEEMQRCWLGQSNARTLATSRWLVPVALTALRDGGATPNFSKLRAEIAQHPAPLHANDAIRVDPGRLKKSAANDETEEVFFVLSAYLTADSFLFSEISKIEPRLPEGRFITAYLGDNPAFDELEQAGWPKAVLGKVRSAQIIREKAWQSLSKPSIKGEPYSDRETFNSLLLHACAALFLPPAPGAPEFMAGAGWRAKSRNTVLAAWAEKKHTWVLHEVEVIGYTAGRSETPPPGLVEPNPEFFRRMGEVVSRGLDWVKASELVIDERLMSSMRTLAFARRLEPLSVAGPQLPSAQVSYDTLTSLAFDRWGIWPPGFPTEEEWRRFTPDEVALWRTRLLHIAEAKLNGLDPESSPEDLDSAPVFRVSRWTKMLTLVRRLEKLSEKQLRGEDWSKEDADYLTRGVGIDVLGVMSVTDSGRDSAPSAHDPKIAPVSSDPNTGKVLHVGTGRMTTLFVLYPWRGSQRLYRGLAIPYYEHVSAQRLNDAEWKQILESTSSPPQPDWLRVKTQ